VPFGYDLMVYMRYTSWPALREIHEIECGLPFGV
jgi:hypothetical protein